MQWISKEKLPGDIKIDLQRFENILQPPSSNSPYANYLGEVLSYKAKT